MKICRGIVFVLMAILAVNNLTAQEIKSPNGYVQLFQVGSSLNKVSEKYIFENDTIKVTYYFWGNRGIMQISVFNKINAPIYIDWKKSFMQNNLDSVLVYAYESEIKPATMKKYKKYVHEGRNLSSMDYEGNAQMMGGEDKKDIETITEVKPKGFYMSLRFNLAPGDFFKFEANASHVSEARNDDGRVTTEVYEADFNQSNSPLKFTSKLVYATTKDFAIEGKVINDFWVSKIREMDAKHFMGEKSGKTPEGFPIYKFPFRKSTSFYVEIDKKNSIVYKTTKVTK